MELEEHGLVELFAGGTNIEHIFCDPVSLIEQISAPCHVESVSKLYLELKLIQTLSPSEGRGHNRWFLELIVNVVDEFVILLVDTCYSTSDLLHHIFIGVLIILVKVVVKEEVIGLK